MSDTETLTVELHADAVEEFRDVVAAEGTDTAGLTAQLSRDRVGMARSISADADLTATADIVKRGRKTGLVECRIHDETDSLVATLESVCLVLRDDAVGR